MRFGSHGGGGGGRYLPTTHDREKYDFAGKTTTNDSTNRNDGGKGGDRGRDRRRGGRERTPMKEQYCKNCKTDAYHIPKNCWELEENKAKRPNDWKSVLE